MTETIAVLEGSLNSPRVCRITLDHPWQWLIKGWHDTLKTPLQSLFYGVLFIIMGYLLTWMLQEHFHYALALSAGFFLVGPFLAMGLYDLSRRIERNEVLEPGLSLWLSMLAWRTNLLSILIFGIIIGLIMVFWVRLSAVLFAAIFVESAASTASSVAAELFFSGDGLKFLIVFTSVGALFALLVFCISVVSIPMLMDRKVDPVTAIVTSLLAVRVNTIPMVLWASLIIIFTGAGLITAYLGLAVTMPLIGHATWHAYRDLVLPETPSAETTVVSQ